MLTSDLTIAANFRRYFRPSLIYLQRHVSHCSFAVVSSRLKKLFCFQ